MKEPKVQVGILFEPQIKFILLTPYHINGEEVSGKQVVTYDNGHILWQGIHMTNCCLSPYTKKAMLLNCRMSPSVSIFIGNERKTSVLSEH